MSIVPADDFFIPPARQNQLRICLAPVHSINALGMSLIDDNNWALLVPQIPNLELVPFLVIQSDSYLRGNVLAPANHNLSVAVS